jgi:hypothetical protein
MAAGLAAQRGRQMVDVEATLIPLAPDSVLARCVESREAQRALPTSSLDKRLARALRSEESAEFAVFPIAIRERVVNLLVVQPASGALGATAVAALGVLVPQIAAAYERLIRVQKLKAQAAAPEPSAPRAPQPARGEAQAPARTETAAAAEAKKAAIGALPLQKRVVKLPAKG